MNGPNEKAAPSGQTGAAKGNTNKQPNGSDSGAVSQSKYALIWAASVTPATRKLVLLAMANYSNADGTGIRPSVATVARHCGLGLTAANAHVRGLKTTGMLRLVRPATQNWPAEYSLNLQKIAESRLPESDSLINARLSESDSLNPPDYRKTCPRLSESDNNPNHPDEVRGVGGDPRGSAAQPPPLGPCLVLPAVVDAAMFNALVDNGPNTKSRIDLLVKEAHGLVASGHDTTAMLRMAIERGWKAWPKPPRPTTPYPTREKRPGAAKGTKSKADRARQLGRGEGSWELPK